jgi:hypothetical protein
MLKTDKWDGFVGGDVKPRTLTDAERLKLVYAPFPVVRVTTPSGHSQAPNWVATATHHMEGDF